MVNVLQSVGLLAEDGRLLATTAAVIAGITYNFLPFMILPVYASLERIDPRMLEAGYDLYGTRRAVFTRVTLPLAMPGVVAGSLLTFIPAVGDFINAELLGTPRQAMIGNVIQSRFLELTDYPTAAALSFILMALVLVVVLIWARLAGHRVPDGGGGALMEAATVTTRVRPVRHRRALAFGRWLLDQSLNLYAALALIYLLAPIAVIIVFSFNDPAGRFNFTWQGFTLDNWKDPFGVPGPPGGVRELDPDRGALDGDRDRARHHDGARAGALPVPGRAATNFFIFLPLATPEIVLGASLLSLFIALGYSTGFTTILIAHVMFNISFVVVTVRSRLIGFDRSLEEAAQDLGANGFQTFLRITLPLIAPGVLAAALLAFALSVDDFVITNFNAGSTGHVPAVRVGRRASRSRRRSTSSRR